MASKKKILESVISGKEKGIKSDISNLLTYQIPEEAMRQLELFNAAAQELEGAKGLAGEATDIARARTSMVEAPGAGIAREDIRQSSASAAQRAIEAGGGSASTLGAITQAGLGEQSAMRDLARQNAEYRSQAELDLINALRGEAGITSSIIGQQAQLRGAGLQTMIGERGKQYESELSKQLTGLQFNTQQLANYQTELENMKNRRAQLLSSSIGAIGSIGSSIFGAVV